MKPAKPSLMNLVWFNKLIRQKLINLNPRSNLVLELNSRGVQFGVISYYCQRYVRLQYLVQVMRFFRNYHQVSFFRNLHSCVIFFFFQYCSLIFAFRNKNIFNIISLDSIYLWYMIGELIQANDNISIMVNACKKK